MNGYQRVIGIVAAGTVLVAAVILGGLFLQSASTGNAAPVPDGYAATLTFERGGRSLSFGPFVGYYFKPDSTKNIERVRFVCRNEHQFYTADLPPEALLFEGQGVLTTLPDIGKPIPSQRRINPVFFSETPDAWLATRPEPEELYRHFHSCHTVDGGAVRTGYWLRHTAKAEFTYDMGGRVASGSPLYHEVKPGEDKGFPAIVEFDHGPGFIVE